MKNNTTIEVKRNVIKNNLLVRFNDLSQHKKLIDDELKQLTEKITNELNNGSIVGKSSKFDAYISSTSKTTYSYKDILKGILKEKFESFIAKHSKLSTAKKLIVELK